MLTYQETITILPWAILLWSVIMSIILVLSNRSMEMDDLKEKLKASHTALKTRIQAIENVPTTRRNIIRALVALLDERIETLCSSYNQLTGVLSAHDVRVSYLQTLKCAPKGAPIPADWGIGDILDDIKGYDIDRRNERIDQYIALLHSSREQNWLMYGWLANQIQKYAEAKLGVLGFAEAEKGVEQGSSQVEQAAH